MNKKKIQLSIALFSIILILSPTYANDCTWNPTDLYSEAFEENLLARMTNLNAPSLAFSVINGTEVFYSKGFGDQPETDIAYHLMSAAKMFTSTAILQLYEQGLIGLEDDFNEYLPYELKNPYYPSTTITIKHLLSHRSSLQGSIRGFEDYWPLLGNGTLIFPSCIYEFFHENGSHFSEANWENWAPGNSYTYSDAGFDILTLILENITATSFDTYVTDNILNPLEMTNTRFSHEDYSPDKLAIGYDWNEASQTNEIVPYLNNSVNPGGGGYFSTVEDMSKYMLIHLNQGEYNGVNILNATTIKLMHTEIEGSNLGLGWWTSQRLGDKIYQGHPGGPHSGFCLANYIRKSLGVVLFTNQGELDYTKYIEIFTFISNKAHKLLEEKPSDLCETNLLFLPMISFLIAAVLVPLYRKRKANN